MISIFEKKDENKERRLPPPDLFASCPYDGVILPYYAAHFESVYILLHPFIFPVSIDKELFYPDTYPSKKEIVSQCEAVSWNKVIELTNLRNFSEIDIGLRTSMHALNKEFSNEAFADEIDKLDKTHNIIRPSEGEIPELIQNPRFEAIQNTGERWFWVGDEFCTERKLVWIDDLKADFIFPAHCCLFTPDKTILVTTHWDSHFSFLCSSKKTIDKILHYKQFEGFFCDEDTEVYWSLLNTNAKTFSNNLFHESVTGEK